jgi:cytoskeletal protein CcmA (bactofilin family)
MRRRRKRGQHEALQPGEEAMKEGPAAEVTVVGRGSRLEGTVVSAGSLRIDGQVTGNIAAEGDVILSSYSQVKADIEAQNVVVAGTFRGNITARAKAELAEGSRVDGDIRSTALVVGEGAVFSGKSIMEVPQEAAASGGGPEGGAEPGKEESPEQQRVQIVPEAAEAGYPEDELREGELRMAHEDAARRAAEWVRSRLPGPRTGPNQPVGEPAPELRRQGGTYPEGRPPKSAAWRWAMSAFIVAVLAAASLLWSLVHGAALASDLGHARAEVRQLQAAEVELRLARSEVASLRADLAGVERLLQEAQVCIGGMTVSIGRLVNFDTEEGLSSWRRTRPTCLRVMQVSEA